MVLLCMQSILSTLNIPLASVIQLSFDRTNIAYEVQEKDAKDPLGQLADLIDRRFYKQSGIVYCLSKSETETVAEVLRKGAPDGHGQPRVRPVRAQAYHAGMPGARRALVQGAWKAGEVDVICATIAFGMGIDKPDVVSAQLHCLSPLRLLSCSHSHAPACALQNAGEIKSVLRDPKSHEYDPDTAPSFLCWCTVGCA